MKVLHINGNYVGTALHQTMIERLDRYVQNQVFAPIYPITLDQLSVVPNKNVIISQCYNKRDRYIFSYKQHKILKSAISHYDVSEFDCIHAYTLFTDGNCAYRLSRQFGKPFIVAVRDSDVNAFFKKAPHLRHRGVEIMRHASRIVFLSKAYLNEVREKYVPDSFRDAFDEKAIVIPNGIDDMWYQDPYTGRDIEQAVKRIAQKKLRLISVGVLTKRKNVTKTLEAIEILRSRGWEIEFTVVGQPIDETVLAAVKSAPGTHYYEKQPMEKVKQFYRENDIFVMPSLTETFGLTYAEAVTQSLPVIYSKGQGFDGQFADGEVGYPVIPTDANDIAKKIERICERYASIAGSCISAEQKYRWDAIVKTYSSIYQEITHG